MPCPTDTILHRTARRRRVAASLVAALAVVLGSAPAARAQQACADADPRAAAMMLAVADTAPPMQPLPVKTWSQLAQGAGGPVLVVTTAADPFSGYLAEILRAEGLNEFTTLDVSAVTPSALAPYAGVVLGAMPLTGAQASMFADWVDAGGALIAMRPDPALYGLLGISPGGAAVANAYLTIDTASGTIRVALKGPKGGEVVGIESGCDRHRQHTPCLRIEHYLQGSAVISSCRRRHRRCCWSDSDPSFPR